MSQQTTAKEGGGVVVASQRLSRYMTGDGSKYENYINYHESRLQFEWGPTNDKDKPGPLEDTNQRNGVTYLVVFFPDDNPFTPDTDESQDIQVLDPLIWDGKSQKSEIKTFSPQALIPDKTGLVVLLPVQINEVSFDGDKYWELRADDCGATYAHQVPAEKKYSRPHWRDFDGNGRPDNKAIGERNYAVAFTRNTRPHIGAKFKIAGASHFGTIKVKAMGTDGVSIPETLATVFGDDVTLPLTEASSALVNTIKFYDKKDEKKAFKLDWEVKIESSGWSKMATTRHTVYVLLADPITPLRQETIADLGCRNANKENSPASARDKIYEEFTDCVVKRLDGKQMTYWKDRNTAFYFTESHEILANPEADGNCQAWSGLFRDVLRFQGIQADRIRVWPKNNDKSLAVKNWTFSGIGQSGNASYPYTVGVDVVPGKRIPAQGNNHSPEYFNGHWITESGEGYYDPSYGAPTVSGKNKGKIYEDGAFDGYGNAIPPSKIRKNNTSAKSPSDVDYFSAN